MTIEEIDEANRLWGLYESSHDLTDDQGKIAAIEPHSGQVVIAQTASEILVMRGKDAPPALLKRIGSPAYYQRGGRR